MNLDTLIVKKAVDVRKQVVWYNKEILMEKKPFMLRMLYTKGIIHINDLLDDDGHFLELNVLSRKYDVTISTMSFNSIKDAIPKTWRKLVKQSSGININPVITVRIGNVNKKLPKLCTKDVYWEFVNRIVEQPTALYKWEEYYYWYDFNWQEIFSNPFKVARETYIQSLQYRILN